MSWSFKRAAHWVTAEPLVHFVSLGALIFIASYALGTTGVDGKTHIVVTAQDLERLRVQSLQQWAKEPTPQQLADSVQAFVREEILVREASAQGLDRDDTVVRRRLAQKMEFLASQRVDAPSDAQLQAYYVAHPARYAQSSTVDMEQLVFRTDTRGVRAAGDAMVALAALRAGPGAQGDASLLPTRLRNADSTRLTSAFGPGFASAAMQAPMGAWVGPVESVYGQHLLRVSDRQPSGAAAFDTVRERVSADLLNERIAAARQAAYATLRKKYTVDVPGAVVQVSVLDMAGARR